MTPSRRRYLLLDLAAQHLELARRGGVEIIGALRDAAIAALLATREDDDISLPAWRAHRDADDGLPTMTGRGGDA